MRLVLLDVPFLITAVGIGKSSYLGATEVSNALGVRVPTLQDTEPTCSRAASRSTQPIFFQLLLLASLGSCVNYPAVCFIELSNFGQSLNRTRRVGQTSGSLEVFPTAVAGSRDRVQKVFVESPCIRHSK